ncbi:polyamine ABC transporter substrate-binding protein, partial [Francisella tularensis subsp. holarctica]|nr:polyamine ABC transporter substrate-binding protein [Francisella tularensis subsp. holarctica]
VPNSWKYGFDKKYLKQIAPCGVSLLDEPEQICGNYFFYHGIDPNTNSKAEYEKAALEIIKNVRPYIKYCDSNKYQNDFPAGNLWV